MVLILLAHMGDFRKHFAANLPLFYYNIDFLSLTSPHWKWKNGHHFLHKCILRAYVIVGVSPVIPFRLFSYWAHVLWLPSAYKVKFKHFSLVSTVFHC